MPFNFSSVSAKNFVAAFGHKEYTAKELHSALNCRRFPSLTKQAIDDEFGARQNFLGCLNASITAEAVPRQQGPDADISPALSAILKSTLQPLWTAFGLFVEKKVTLRKSAIIGCYPENQMVQKLLESNMLSEPLFDKEAVEEVFTQAEHQAKSVAALLDFKQPYKRPRYSGRGRGTPNRRGQFYRGRQARNPQRGGRGNYHQNQNQNDNQQLNYLVVAEFNNIC